MQALITRTLAAIATVSVLGLTSTAIAAPPAIIASQAWRGQLAGIGGYQQLQLDLSSGRVSISDVLKAAGETPTPDLEYQVKTFLNDYVRISN